MTPADVVTLIERETAPLRAELASLRTQLDLYRQAGLDVLQTLPLSDHPHLYEEAAPTDSAPDGTIRIVRTGATDYVYGRSNGAWVRVALS